MARLSLILGGSVLMLCTGILAAESEYADANRRLFATPRTVALGFSDIVFCRDATPNGNPANLSLDSSQDITLAYAGFYRNAFSTTLLSYVTVLPGVGGIGVSANYLFVPHIIDTRGWAVDGDGVPVIPSTLDYATASEMYVHVGYGYRWDLGRVQGDLGVGVHALRRRLLEWTGYGIGLDCAGAVAFRRSGIRTALIAENITTSYLHWSDSYQESVYPHLRVGIGWRREFPYIYGTVQVTYTTPDLLSNEGANATDYLTQSGSRETPRELRLTENPEILVYGNYGLEYTISEIVSVRVGVENLRRVTFGAGVRFLDRRLGVDFAYLTHQLAGSYFAAISWRWH